ncbi:butyrophilin subfamily 3 member A2-like [Myripristis murdjan]|uniref:butyrophilin subfamily 3 member A2-like n=1 Tax=Myripristis murdjan TaxID=586833 RepID=UPI0011763E3F|nr:butyrophilin subfamily 3 member A2-like [Myripristis murdjan]
MSHLKDGLSIKSQFSVFTALVFHHTAVFLFLTSSCEGQSQLIGPPQPIVAILGEDIILPCHLEPAMDAVAMTVEWARPDLKPKFIYVWRDGVGLLVDQNPSYKDRTSLFINKLNHGDVSLKLSEVKLSDEGRYRCFIPSIRRETFIQLNVGSVSSPVLGINKDPSGVVLECESKGWYPEPELFWLDAEGKLLSAGAPETVRGPDGLYTVSSRVTVEKSHGNSFTCRVQQSKIQQTRETQIHIQGDFFMDITTADCSCSTEHIVIGFAVVFLCISFAFFVYKWRQNKIETKTQEREGEKTESVRNNVELEVLMEGERNREQVSAESDTTKNLDTKNAKLEKQQKKENKEKQMEPGETNRDTNDS